MATPLVAENMHTKLIWFINRATDYQVSDKCSDSKKLGACNNADLIMSMERGSLDEIGTSWNFMQESAAIVFHQMFLSKSCCTKHESNLPNNKAATKSSEHTNFFVPRQG